MDLESLSKIKSEFNFNPTTILDVGANNGWFSDMCKQIWPSSNITLIEANPCFEPILDGKQYDFTICLLGNENKPDVPFYILKEEPGSTASSIYKEISEYFSGDKYTTISLPMYRLDDVTIYPFDFIKMDTQGSELDIIKGGINTVKKCKYLLIEVSLVPCNEGAPLKEDVVNYLKSINFKVVSTPYSHYLNGKLLQEDLLFENSVL